jgi:hypothetical protein
MSYKVSNRRELGQRKTPQRNLAAPFQNKSPSRNTSHCGAKSAHYSGGYVDYRNFKFQKLDDYSEITFENYCGPTPESNWVIPGTLLVGAYPASQDDEETYELITSILKEGVTKFVCLQQEVIFNDTVNCTAKQIFEGL